ncbi:Similar to gustatory receptor 659.1, partial [Cotesia congregata]
MYNNNRKSLLGSYKIIQHVSSKIIGLAPWTLKVSSIFSDRQQIPNRNITYSSSWVGTVYNIILFLGIASFGIYRMIVNAMSQRFSNSLLSMTIYQLLFVTLINASFIPLIYIIRQKSIMKAINNLKIVDFLLSQCADYTLESDYTNDVIYAINMLMNFGLITLDLFNSLVMSVLFESIPSIISSGVMIQYAIQLNKMNRRFSSINSAFSKLGNHNLKSDINYVPSETQVVQSRALILHAIDITKKAYIELCEICEMITDFYGIPILIAIFSFSVRALFTVYISILSILQIQFSTIRWYLLAIRIIFAIFLFTTLTCSVTTIAKQNKRLALIISHQTDQPEIDEKVEKNLLKFASDLRHLKVEVTACNIIPLD